MSAETARPNGPNNDEASPSSTPSQVREAISLKRGREGSVDHLANEIPSITPIATKKNRVDGEHAAPEASENEEELAVHSTSVTNASEGHTVNEVRKKVQEMGWKEGEPKPTDAEAEPSDMNTAVKAGDKEELKDDVDEATAKTAEAGKTDKAPADEIEPPAGGESPTLKRKASEVAAAEDKKHKSASPPPVPASAEQATEAASSAAAPSAPAAPAKKPQATFGSFSSKASPFASASSSSSPFAKTTSTNAFGAASTSSPFASAAKPKSALDAAAPKSGTNSFASSGFGNYSSTSSPFARKPPAAEEEKEASEPSSTFGDILKERGDGAEDDERLHLERKDGTTGEEEEDTVFSTRAKLFVMEAEGAWKERGVGQLKINRRRDDGSTRLIMRAEGVLRLILNAKLYVGMPCLEDGKHVRSTVFEEGERRFITIRTANPKTAQELGEAVHEHTPLESRASASKSPQPENQV